MKQANIASGANFRFWFQLYSLIGAVLLIGLSSYFVVPMLPIYCVEQVSHGGLGWSRSEACSLYGTYLAVAHIAPFIGGVLADFLFGQFISVVLGYILGTYGLFLLWFFPESMLIPGFLLFGLGTGCVKVSLATAVGKLCSGEFLSHREKAYDYHYFVSCLGFIAGNFFSSLFFDIWGMKILFLLGFGAIFISSVCYFFCKPKSVFEKIETMEKEVESSGNAPPWPALFGMLIVSVLFFACGNQLNSSIALFLHQEVDRGLFGFAVPTLWFSVFGYVVMMMCSPLRRKIWSPFERSISFIEPVKLAVGLLLLGSAFLLFSSCAAFSEIFGKNGTLLLLLVAMGFLFISDVHVRPLLFSSAAKFAPQKYHTIASAVVYSAVGFGGKLAGMVASTVDAIGFPLLFLSCAGTGVVVSVFSLLIWKKFSGYAPEIRIQSR